LKMAFGYLREALKEYLRTPTVAAAVASVQV
jgi:hypothetical protein